MPDEPWQDILDSAPDAMLLVGPHGRIGMVNRQLESMLGYERGELIGQLVEVLVPERYREHHVGHRLGYMADPKIRPMGHAMELHGLRKDGSEVAVEVSLSPIEHEVGRIVSVAVRDVTARRQAEQESRALLDTAPDAMVIVDGEGRITLVNRQLEAMFGYERDDLLGKPVEVLVPEGQRGNHHEHRARYAVSPRVRQMGHQGLALNGLRRDGTEFAVEISLSPLETPRGRLVSAAIRDATERVETERRLRELDMLKDEFLSVVSHELRTPLTAISGFAQLLLARGDRIDHQGQQDMLARIARNAGEMDRLVGQLLDLSRLDAGQVALQLVPTPLDEAVRACVDTLADEVASRVRIDVADDLVVLADGHALDRVLSNLLTNAAKFSPDGGTVEVSAVADADGCVLVSVADEGIGIPLDEQEKVFDRFYQLSKTDRGPRHGTGIGLSIVRRYVELLGGDIQLESTPGAGATFSFSLRRG